MHIKSIELDGFKSYAKRQLITGFHKQFNAITGYNGSGKSNILDGICFLLGLSKLENIRAKNMTDLIFKQGQAGVNKAVVTIVFDNSDESKSPMGMKDYKEIIIRRQIVAGATGRGVSSSYTFNGMPATNNRIHDFFRGIGLNVNNPHFLIMQGRITKVLNMKPEEILGMIEEAAGTKMYDQKRKDAEKTINQKDQKLGECEKIITESLDPKVEKMREDRKNMVEITRMKVARTAVQRKLDAYVYWQNKNMEVENQQLVEETKGSIDESKARIEEIDKMIEEKNQKCEDLEQNKNDDTNAGLEVSLKARTEERINKEGEKEEIADQIKQIEEDRKRKKASIEKDQKLLEKKTREFENINNANELVDEQQKQDLKHAEQYRTEIEALTRGTMADENGEQISIEQKIQESRTETSELEASIQTAQRRQLRLDPRITQLKDKLKYLKEQNQSAMSEMSQREKEVKQANEKIAKIKFDEHREVELNEKANVLQREVKVLEDKCSNLLRTYHRGRFDFVYNDPPVPDFDRKRDVRGTVATLFTLKPGAEKYGYAVEIAGGNYLQQVVVSTQNVARSMVEHKVITTRKTFIPVKESRKKTPTWSPWLEESRMEPARQIAARHNEEVVHIIDLIEYPSEMNIIMENIFGNILVTGTLTCAKEIAYNPKCRTRVLSIRGDDVKANGVMSGGHNDRSDGSVFNSLAPLHVWRKELRVKVAELEEIAAEIEQTRTISAKYHELKEMLATAQRKHDAVLENLRNSEFGVLQNELDSAIKELEEVTQEVVDKKKRFEELGTIVKELESRKKNDKGYQEKEKKKLREKLEEVEARLGKNKETREETSRTILAKRAEVEELTAQIESDLKNVDGRLVEMEGLKVKLEEKNAELEKAIQKEQAIRDELDTLKRTARQQDEDMKKVLKAIDSHKREKLKITSNIENLEKMMVRYEDCVKQTKLQAAKQKKKCEWIVQDEQHFGKKNTEYDFDGFSEARGLGSIEEITKKLEALERKINTKNTNAFDEVESKLAMIKQKKNVVKQDKATLLRTIDVLDIKKVEEIEKAYNSVNADFGNIFSTLLPGAHAQLTPVEGKSVLDGVEVRVSFNGQWKESLQELSGGQRSLVALSLILAMLKFKPAPLYILDEVDAALDLSHTANIGKMIKTHFTNSQFVVVSLKEGMFSNADVLFQTKFVDGTSTVKRTENHQLA